MLRPRQLLFILSIECIEKYKDTVGLVLVLCNASVRTEASVLSSHVNTCNPVISIITLSGIKSMYEIKYKVKLTYNRHLIFSDRTFPYQK